MDSAYMLQHAMWSKLPRLLTLDGMSGCFCIYGGHYASHSCRCATRCNGMKRNAWHGVKPAG